MQVWLYEKLQQKGLTQAELARRIDVHPRSLCKKFQGKQPFLYREVVAICRELEIDNPLRFDWGQREK